MKCTCKFCGKEFSAPEFIVLKYDNNRSCGECTTYCMRECEIAGRTTMSWHKEPCVSCKHNPYRSKHTWNGKKWIEND